MREGVYTLSVFQNTTLWGYSLPLISSSLSFMGNIFSNLSMHGWMELDILCLKHSRREHNKAYQKVLLYCCVLKTEILQPPPPPPPPPPSPVLLKSYRLVNVISTSVGVAYLICIAIAIESLRQLICYMHWKTPDSIAIAIHINMWHQLQVEITFTNL